MKDVDIAISHLQRQNKIIKAELKALRQASIVMCVASIVLAIMVGCLAVVIGMDW